MFLLDAKEDTREKCGGWAPGNYIGTCLDCKGSFIGDKRAIECADCAYKNESKQTGEG